MKILCDRQQLQEAFAVVSGIAPQKTPKPILQSVLVSADGDQLKFYATDGDMSASVVVGAVKVEEPGQVLLPARETSALLRELAESTLSFESREFRCKLVSGAGSFVLVGDDPAKFPPESGLEEGQRIEIRAGRFLEMVRQSMFAAAREETRYAINGLLLDTVDDSLRLVATDGRRLALCFANLEETPKGGVRAVVPLRAVQALSRAISENSEETLLISVTGNQIGFSIGSVTLISQLLENRFPEYEAVIPKVADTTVEIDREQLEKNVRRVAILCSGDVRMINLNFTSSSLELSAESSGVGRADVAMEVDVKGAGGSIAFNPDFLLDALKVSDREVIHLDMTDESTPAKLTLDESFTYVLMPISGS